MSANMKVDLNDIKLAQKVIAPFIESTTCAISRSCTQAIGQEVFLKLENTQRTGSFKIRGAVNKIKSLTESERKSGVIACSAGNHAQGVALSATLNDIESVIVMPETASLNKIQATENYGAQVILHGQVFDEAKEYAYKLAKEKSYVFVHPYEDEKVIAGQGTIGVEVFEQVQNLEQMIVPIGGGGLISGIAVALKALNPKVKIVGVQSQATDTMYQLFNNKKYIEPKMLIPSIADGIAIKNPSQNMYDSFISKYVDEVVTVSEGEIAEAIVFLMERAKTVAEGAGATALAALLSGKVAPAMKNAVVICGGNIDLNIVSQIIQKGQIQRGRLSEMSVIVPDIPGSLSQLTKILAEHKANILEVHHDRVRNSLLLKETKIDFVIETTGPEHLEKIRTSLKQWGAVLV